MDQKLNLTAKCRPPFKKSMGQFRNILHVPKYQSFEGFGTARAWMSGFGVYFTIVVPFLFQVAQGAMEAKKDAHTWDFKSLMFEKTTTGLLSRGAR